MALILLIDDAPRTCELLRTICQYAGHQALEAYSAEQGLQLAQAHRPHLIITDVHMPLTSGLDLLHTLKHNAQLAAIPVLVTSMTGNLGDSEREALRLGAVKFIPGPIEVQTLIATIEECLRAQP
jgi:CheY-like chemotaxis protein